jgi:predicted XRE-type DNA-binding protein
MKDDTTIRHGGKNIFADLGFPDPETHLLKAGLVKRMDEIIEEKGLTLEAAAERMSVRGTDLARLARGQFREISVESLINMLARLGCEVEIVVRERGTPGNAHEPSRASAAE